MKVQPLMSLFSLLLVTVFLLFMPLLTRRGIFFSATVDPEFPHTREGRRLLRSYRVQVAVWITIVVLLTMRMVPGRANFAGIVPLALLIVGTAVIYWRKFREIHARYGVHKPEVRQATLSVSAANENFNTWVILVPFVALAAVAVYLSMHWNDLPQQFPMHWGDRWPGPNRWTNRDWQHVYGPLLLGAYENVILLALAWIMSHESRKTVMRYVTVRGVLFLLYPLTLSFALAALQPLLSIPVWLGQGVVLVSIVGLLYWSYRKVSAPQARDDVPEPQSDDYWKAGFFYWNPDDPAILVSKRVGIGYTMNFANKWSWIALATILVAFLVPSVLKSI
jgi:uncharacterized membrane protein